MKNIKSKIKNLINPFKRNKKVNKIFYNLFWKSVPEKEDFSGLGIVNTIDNYRIIDVKSRKVKDELEIQVTTARPGILIGKAGSNIKQIEADLSNAMNCVCKIKIVEHDLWKFNKYN